MTQLKTIEQTINLTISNADFDEQEIVLTFTNGSFIVFQRQSSYYGESFIEIAETFNPYEALHRSVKLGFLTKEQTQAYTKQQEEKRKENDERRERMEYERLAAKFKK